MRFLANENLPRAVVEGLRAAGHDVAWMRVEAPGATEDQVLAQPSDDGRVLVTLDKDFGELDLRRGLAASQGVVFLRLPLAGQRSSSLAPSPRSPARNYLAGHARPEFG